MDRLRAATIASGFVLVCSLPVGVALVRGAGPPPGTIGFPPHAGIAPDDAGCRDCHRPAAVARTRGTSAHATLSCSTCHESHGETSNLFLIREVIQTPNSGPRAVVFLGLQGPNSYADGDSVYDGVCEVCHTTAMFHRNDPTGDHDHFAAANCSTCHEHWDGFAPTGVADHPQAVTDCANCHSSPTTGDPELLGAHGFDCASCHPADFSGTILGPLGTWQGQCDECHNPAVAQTGNLQTPTKGHRCVLCHGEQRAIVDARAVHETHLTAANCIACHGFIPETGTAIGSGNRDVCAACHAPGQHDQTPQRQFHERHVTRGASCLECHGGVRPAVDVVVGPSVGNSTHVCAICHANRTPDDFVGREEELHRRHVSRSLDCGACHAQAQLQDDRSPMPPLDDSVRAGVDRQGLNECAHCHEGGQSDTSPEVHYRHVATQWQWCFNCHVPDDPRPSGEQPPVTRAAESCALCHTGREYTDAFPYSVHHRHAERNKCYACHQLDPRLSDWPAQWLASGCALATWYRDADADGHGDPLSPHVSCDAPPQFVALGDDCDDGSAETYPGAFQVCDGVNNDCDHPSWPAPAGTNEADDDGDSFSECQGDCDDQDPATYPGALEIHDGRDNQCPGDGGHGLIDEISGGCVFVAPTRLAWEAQPGATGYEIARSGTPSFSPDCILFASADAFFVDPEIPAEGAVFHYLVRSATPNRGSWGQTSAGVERVVACAR